MERRGIRTEKGDYNRAIIMEENTMMRQVRARVSSLHGWSITEHLRMYDILKYSWRYQRKLERLNPKRRKRFEQRHASKRHAYHTAIDYFAEHNLSMEDWTPPRWKSRLDKACKERYDCEYVQTEVKKELEYLETIRLVMNEMHRRPRGEIKRGNRIAFSPLLAN